MTREAYNQYFREYRAKNREKIREYNRVYNSNWRKLYGYHSEELWKARNPEKEKAHKILQYAVKKGRVKKFPCEVCQNPNSVAHHTDYSEPLKVIWLCKVHHYQIHNVKA